MRTQTLFKAWNYIMKLNQWYYFKENKTGRLEHYVYPTKISDKYINGGQVFVYYDGNWTHHILSKLSHEEFTDNHLPATPQQIKFIKTLKAKLL